MPISWLASPFENQERSVSGHSRSTMLTSEFFDITLRRDQLRIVTLNLKYWIWFRLPSQYLKIVGLEESDGIREASVTERDHLMA